MADLRMVISRASPAVNIRLENSRPSIGLQVDKRIPVGIIDYEKAINKPSIEGHTLVGDSTLPQIGVRDVTPQQIDNIIFGG